MAEYTEQAGKVLQLAKEEAIELGHKAVGTEHLLLGILDLEDCVASMALQQLGVSAVALREQVRAAEQQDNTAELAEVKYTPRMEVVLQLAREEANRWGMKLVATEHLLLGLLEEGEGVAVRLLEQQKLSPETIAKQVIAMLGGARALEMVRAGSGENAPAMGMTLEDFGRNVNEAVKRGKVDPIIGRERELERVIQVLCRRTKNNPALLGQPGVGKTAIAEGLAQRIVEGAVPKQLLDKVIYTLDLGAVVAGAKYRGDFEERMKKIIDEVKENPEIILFIDEMHTLIGAGAGEGSLDAANILKPELARGTIHCIGATTQDEFRKYIEKDAALERRFQPILVEEPTQEEAVAILKGLRSRYEEHHNVAIADEALEAAVKLSARYLTDRYLPDKAIDLMDEAASRVRLYYFSVPRDFKVLEEEIEELSREKESAVFEQDFEKAALCRELEKQKKAQLKALKEEVRTEENTAKQTVTAEHIAEIVSQWTGVPVTKLQAEDKERLLHLEELLHKRLVGQDEAVTAVSKAVRRAQSGLKSPKRPIGSFLFLGPTGVGKTELARALAEVLFDDENAIVRIDMSEYMEKFAVSRLVGAPPGYVGHEEGGQLTEAVRRKPYSIVLLDEIEKAHPDLFNILLQVLDDGRLTDSQGRTVDFKNTVIIMTSNLGATANKGVAAMGFSKGDALEENKADYEKMKTRVLEALKNTFRPEFLNRVDETLVFHSLTKEHIQSIVEIMLNDLRKQLGEMGMTLELSEEARTKLVEDGFDPAYGARPLRRTIQKQVEDPLSEELLQGKFREGDIVRLEVADNRIVAVKGNAPKTKAKPKTTAKQKTTTKPKVTAKKVDEKPAPKTAAKAGGRKKKTTEEA